MSFAHGALLTATEVVGDFAFKQAVNTGDQRFRALGYASYLALGQVLFMLLHGDKLSILNAYWDLSSNIATYLLGWLYFGEPVSNKQHLGFILALAAGILLKEEETK